MVLQKVNCGTICEGERTSPCGSESIISASCPNYERAQVGDYVKQHLTYADANRKEFTESEIDEIDRFSSVTARLVNKVCTHSLWYGAQKGYRLIGDHMVKRLIEGELS